MKPKYILIDFVNRDRAEVFRFVFSLAKVQFEDVRFDLPSAEWDKYKEETHFCELPILEVDGTPLIKDKTILGYLAREFGYYGESNWECTLIDCMVDVCEEFNGPIEAIFHTEGEDKQELVEYFRDHTLPKVLDALLKLAMQNPSHGRDEGYMAGDDLSVADLMVLYSLELAASVIHKEPKEIIKNYPRFASWRERLLKDKRIHEWTDGLFAVFVQQDRTDVNVEAKSPKKCSVM